MEMLNRHSMLRPKDSGILYGSLSDEEVRKISPNLTEDERSDPHSKYYYDMPAELTKEHKMAINLGAMDPEDAFDIRDYGKHMNTAGHCKVENGYCVLPSGITYAAALIRQAGRTDEMIDYYNEYFATKDSLFYKIWYPESHYLHYLDGCVEDFGFGRLNMKFVSQVESEMLGIKNDKILQKDPSYIYVGGTSVVGYNLDSSHPERAERNTIVLYHRKTDYGREVRIRLWYGIGIENNRFEVTIPDPQKALTIAKKTMVHIMQEYTNDQYLETKFWEDTHN